LIFIGTFIYPDHEIERREILEPKELLFKRIN